MVSLNVSLPQLQLFFLVFLRVGAILMSIPIFDSRGIPFFFKIALAFATGIVLFPLLKLEAAPMTSNLFALGISAAGEIFLGLAIGFSVKLIFAGIQLEFGNVFLNSMVLYHPSSAFSTGLSIGVSL